MARDGLSGAPALMPWAHSCLHLVLWGFVKLFVDCCFTQKCFLSPAPLSNPELKSLQPSLEIEIGQNVTLSCLCTNGALPINYTFFRNQSLLSIITMKDRNPALHNLTINSASDLGEYKCKAENRNVNSSKYSTGLTFTFLEENDPSYLLCIFLGLLFLLVVIAIALLIPFWILPWCKARKLKSAGSSRSFVSTEKATGSENYVTYTEIEYAKSEEMEYANVLITGKEDNRKVNIRADTTIVYSEIIRRDEMQAEPRHSPE
nr:allergin-1 isoform X3 [Pelodiscus sinensis]|eukprot:XP_025036341.1 allergin-1 isoform X3 [Pelodiscus sinensis]